MKIDFSEIRCILKTIGFNPKDGCDNIFVKQYPYHFNYEILVDLNGKGSITYDTTHDGISVGDRTTSNFEKMENLVVLECIDRLLTKGYAPSSLILEKKYPLGKKEKGKLDITVLDHDGNTYLLVECKTISELEKEKSKMLKDGGQLFSYFTNDRSAKYLCLYSSGIIDGSLIYKNYIVQVEESWRSLSNCSEIFSYWNQFFKTSGLFESDIPPYGVELKSLTRRDLQELTSEDSGRIFNQFAEILRHNVVSDKPNAFNKILNIFICKIKDEDKNDRQELDFQWKENDTDESLLKRLNDLYKEGMEEFLDIEVSDYTDVDLEKALQGLDDPKTVDVVRGMFDKLRLQKNPEFAFIEVYDDASFRKNAIVVREVVQLLQPYQFRYGHKQQFLGTFFELLLSTSMKQESGQFFTPVPLCRFIIGSLPVKDLICSKASESKSEILPTVIDYACGTGHFLTEYMDIVQNIIEGIDTGDFSRTVQKKIGNWQNDGKLDWASDYVYGIDADYRLVKSAKVSSFLNGDGEANIFCANGLDSFTRSDIFRGKLRKEKNDGSRNNPQFDIVVANPPFSVSAFKQTIPYGSESFELYPLLTDKSSEIECLFVERTKQLLRIGGIAAIIVPSSLMDGGGIYASARKIIFRYFKIKAIVKLGTGTFMKTGTATNVLFMVRREDEDADAVSSAVDTFLHTHKDMTVLGIERPFSRYSEYMYGDTLEDSLRKGHLNESERERMEIFILTYGQEMLYVKSGDKEEESAFLGYKFSSHRGREGIIEKGGMLYSQSQTDRTKVNSYIYSIFKNEKLEIDPSLSQHIAYSTLSEHIGWGPKDNYYVKQRRNQMGKIPDGMVRLKDSCICLTSDIISDEMTESGKYPLFGASGIIKMIPTYQTSSESIAVIKDGFGSGRCFLIPPKSSVIGTISILVPNEGVDLNYLYCVIKNGNLQEYISGKNQRHLYFKDYGQKLIPLPNMKIQKQIADELLHLESQIDKTSKEIRLLRTSEQEMLLETFGDIGNNPKGWKTGKLRDVIASVSYGTSKPSSDNGDHKYLRMGNITDDGHLDLSDIKYISVQSKELDKCLVKRGDILFNRTNSSDKVGKTCVFNMDEPMIIAGYILRVRLNDKATPEFISGLINSLEGKEFMRSITKDSIHQSNINANEFQDMPIFIPPLELQQRYSEFVNTTESRVLELSNRMKNEIKKYDLRVKELIGHV